MEQQKNKFKSIIASIKVLSILEIVICCMMFLAIVVCTTSYSLDISKNSIEELQKDEEILDYTSTLNAYSYSGTIEVFKNIDNKTEFIVFELIIPSIFLVFGYILLIISLQNVILLIKNVTDKKSLFTNEKYQLLKKIILRTDIALFFIVGNINLFLWVIIGIFLEIILYLFNYCDELTNNKKI